MQKVFFAHALKIDVWDPWWCAYMASSHENTSVTPTQKELVAATIYKCAEKTENNSSSVIKSKQPETLEAQLQWSDLSLSYFLSQT